MKCNKWLAVFSVLAFAAAVVAAIYCLQQKGILRLKKTNFQYEEEFPDEEIVIE